MSTGTDMLRSAHGVELLVEQSSIPSMESVARVA
jgi:hypothetical protein